MSIPTLVKKPKQFVIAITGPSTSERKKLCEELIKLYGNKADHFAIIGLDAYRKRSGLPQTMLRGKMTSNLDLSDSYDVVSFFNCISNTYAPVLLLHGTILFAYQQLYTFVDLCINLEFDYENDYKLVLKRRIDNNDCYKGSSIPSDYLQNPWGPSINYYCAYFHDIVWEEAKNHPEYRRPSNWVKPGMTLSAKSSVSSNSKQKFIY